MQSRRLGATGLSLSPVALGLGSLGGPDVSEGQARGLLEGALEQGVTLFDAARSYGEAEARAGRHLRPYRDRILLSTKVGYGVEGIPDWTGPCITAGVEQALRLLQTDRIDVVHLHSCPSEVLARGDVVEALLAAKAAGKLRLAAYSGDGEDLSWAVDSGHFDSVQASFNLCDRNNRPALDRAGAAGQGVMLKRALANAAWRGPSPGAEVYAERWSQLGLELDEPASVALRYAAHHGPGDCVLVGTRTLSHLEAAIAAVEAGPLTGEQLEPIESSWARHGASWSPHI